MKDIEEIKEKIIKQVRKLGEKDRDFLNLIHTVLTKHLKR